MNYRKFILIPLLFISLQSCRHEKHYIKTPDMPVITVQTEKPSFVREPLEVITVPRAYADNCARCHGMDGSGQGPDAYDAATKTYKLPEPAPLACPAYSMHEDSRENMEKAVRNGIPGKMPSFRFSQQELDDIFSYMQFWGRRHMGHEGPHRHDK